MFISYYIIILIYNIFHYIPGFSVVGVSDHELLSAELGPSSQHDGKFLSLSRNKSSYYFNGTLAFIFLCLVDSFIFVYYSFVQSCHRIPTRT